MRLPERVRVALAICTLAAAAAHAAPEAVRSEMNARLQASLPQVKPADFALGSAAVDPELREKVAANANAAPPVLAEGRRLWTRRFRNGRQHQCFRGRNFSFKQHDQLKLHGIY